MGYDVNINLRLHFWPWQVLDERFSVFSSRLGFFGSATSLPSGLRTSRDSSRTSETLWWFPLQNQLALRYELSITAKIGWARR